MRKAVAALPVLLVLFVSLQACHKDVQTEWIKEITIDTAISVNTHFELDLAPYGDEGDIATILERGNQASVSDLQNQTDMFTTVYNYTPSEGAMGADHVVLSVSHDPLKQTNRDSTIIYINFNIR